MGEEPIFIDAEQYQGKGDEKITFKGIVLEHLKRIGTLAAQDFHGGYTIHNKESGVIESYIPDTREAYSNAVDYLFDITSPHFDKQMLKDIEEFQVWESKTERDLFIKYTLPDEKGLRKWVGGEEAYKTDKVKTIQRQLFRLINSFLYRVKYMEKKSFTDES